MERYSELKAKHAEDAKAAQQKVGTHSLTRSLTHSLTHSFIHTLTHSLTRSLPPSLTHSLTTFRKESNTSHNCLIS